MAHLAVLLLPLLLHPAVLEPDLDLPLGQVQHLGEVDPALQLHKVVEVELLLQLQDLGGAEDCSLAETVVTRGERRLGNVIGIDVPHAGDQNRWTAGVASQTN